MRGQSGAEKSGRSADKRGCKFAAGGWQPAGRPPLGFVQVYILGFVQVYIAYTPKFTRMQADILNGSQALNVAAFLFFSPSTTAWYSTPASPFVVRVCMPVRAGPTSEPGPGPSGGRAGPRPVGGTLREAATSGGGCGPQPGLRESGPCPL